MAEIEQFEREYRARASYYERLADEVEFALAERLTAENIKTHLITKRVKTLESVRDKAQRKAYDDALAQVEDIVGVRVVVLFLSDLPRVRAIVRELFDVASEDDTVEGGEIREFGYMSVHLVARLQETHAGPRYDALKDFVFEIQLRTIVMDAWANVSHYLDYKGASSVPSELRRDFFALSGLFYVADQHFELFFRHSAASQERAGAELTAGAEEALEVNLDTVEALVARLYPDRERSDRPFISEFVEEITAIGITELAELEDTLRRAGDAALAYEVEFYSDRKPAGRRFKNIGIARAALAIARPDYAEAAGSDDWAADHAKFRHLVHDS